MKRTEKIICYVLMCVSSFSGMYMLYETVLREVSSWEGGLNASAAFGLTLLLKYPVLFLYRKCKTDAAGAAVPEDAGDRILWSGSDRLSSACD